MILADTSVWIDHLRHRNWELVRLLEADDVACHPFVIGELALGRLSAEILALLERLPAVLTAAHHEVMSFVDARRLADSGIFGCRVWQADGGVSAPPRRPSGVDPWPT